MAIYLLDTDILSLYQRGHPVVVARVATTSVTDDVMTSAVTVEEQISGRMARIRVATNPTEVADAYRHLTETVLALAELPVLAFSVPAIGNYTVLLKQKLNIRKNDLRIAAIAFEVNATVVTRNVRDFARVPGLKIEDWSVPAGP